ncbi:hypothetical protein [Rhodococcus jostii]|uniref:hypothetical protein n=1 Tax=Rhodococcus jostii TaxID=132919 RepID=UPI0036680042
MPRFHGADCNSRDWGSPEFAHSNLNQLRTQWDLATAPTRSDRRERPNPQALDTRNRRPIADRVHRIHDLTIVLAHGNRYVPEIALGVCAHRREIHRAHDRQRATHVDTFIFVTNPTGCSAEVCLWSCLRITIGITFDPANLFGATTGPLDTENRTDRIPNRRQCSRPVFAHAGDFTARRGHRWGAAPTTDVEPGRAPAG